MSMETTAFNSLANVSSKVAIDAVYYLTRLIRHRDILTTGESLIVRGIKNEPTKEAESIAVNLLKKIEDEEKSPIAYLNTEEIDYLISTMDKIVAEKYTEGLLLNEEKGRSLLEEMRQIDKPHRMLASSAP